MQSSLPPQPRIAGFANVESRCVDHDSARLSSRIEDWRPEQASQRQPTAALDRALDPARPHWKVCDGLPEIEATDLQANILRQAIHQHGALLVRNLLPQNVLPGLILAIDRVTEACGGASRGHYFSPPDALRIKMPKGELGRSRAFHRDSGSIMCAEAPSVAETLLELYADLGLKALLTDYLGELPCLSVKKWVLRKTLLPVHQAGWHQDGAFMGADIHSINVWIPLTRCGGDTGAPGMDMVPARLHNIVSADGALFDWSVSPESVTEQFSDTPPVAPVFNPGDALLFDHFFLHRTQYRSDFQRPRYALETWFFGQSAAPLNQVPIRW